MYEVATVFLPFVVNDIERMPDSYAHMRKK